MDWNVVTLNFLLTALVFLVGGLLAGSALGLFFGWLLKLLYKARPGLRPPFMLFPWRTILLAMLVISCTVTLSYVLKPGKELIDKFMLDWLPAVTFLVLVLLLVTDRLLIHWLPTGLGVKLTGLLRTLAVTGVALVLIGTDPASPLFGAGPGGYSLLRAVRVEVASTLKLDDMWIMLGVVAGLGLALDLLLGVVQMLFGLGDKRKAKKTVTEAMG